MNNRLRLSADSKTMTMMTNGVDDQGRMVIEQSSRAFPLTARLYG